MEPRPPRLRDVQHLQRAVGIVSAYDIGSEDRDFEIFASEVESALDEAPAGTMQALAQLSWLLLRSMEARGPDRHAVLAWYGRQFADAEELMGEP